MKHHLGIISTLLRRKDLINILSYKCRIYGCSRSIYYRIHKFVSFRNHDLLNISLGRGF